MLKRNGNGDYDKYCDWCGKFCGPAGVSTFSHQFCSERCKRSYDNAHGTVDGGHKQGSVGHVIHKINSFIVKTITIIIVTAVVIGIILYLFKK